MKRRIATLGLVFQYFDARASGLWRKTLVYQTRTVASALIGDSLRLPAFLRENIPVTFIENVEALNADSLKDFQLLVILRDGMNWPNGYEKEPVKWMTELNSRPSGILSTTVVDSFLFIMLKAFTLPVGSTTSCLAATTEAS